MFSLLTAFIGYYFFKKGSAMEAKWQQAAAQWFPATAMLTGYEERMSQIPGSVTMLYYPKVDFLIREGHRISTVASYGGTPVKYKQGDQIPITYNPQDPRQIQITNDGNANFLYTGLKVLGLVMAISMLFAAIVEFIVYGVLIYFRFFK